MKEKLKARIEELRKQNDQANQTLAQLEQTRNQIIQEILVRNGRILELQEILEDDSTKDK
jgi:prefoldin subunit 5